MAHEPDSEAERRHKEREARKLYEATPDFAKLQRVQRRAALLFQASDHQSSKQTFDFVQRAITTAVVIAADIYFFKVNGTAFDNWLAASLWILTAVGLIIISVRLALATFVEANRFGVVITLEMIDGQKSKYSRGLRRTLSPIVTVSVLLAIFSLGATVGSQAIQGSVGSDQSCPGPSHSGPSEPKRGL